MTNEDVVIGLRVYNRYRDLFGEIKSLPDGNSMVLVKYEWPVDPNVKPYLDPVSRLKFAYEEEPTPPNIYWE